MKLQTFARDQQSISHDALSSEGGGAVAVTAAAKCTNGKMPKDNGRGDKFMYAFLSFDFEQNRLSV